MSWSGGKDSAFALWQLQQDPAYRVRALFTTITETYDRISMHGVRREILYAQAAALDLPVVEVTIPPDCVNDTYEARMTASLAHTTVAGIDTYAFADLYLVEVRAYREQRLHAAGKRAIFPLWERDTDVLAKEFIGSGFRAIVACVDPQQLDPSFLGRDFDEAFLDELPDGVDPCGENGEFHTFVHAAPNFAAPIPVRRGETLLRDGFAFCDLLLA